MAVDLKKVPSTPGVYKFFNKTEIIYIGKAKNLKKRVSSYFGNSYKDRKTSQIRFLTDRIETFTTKNEVEGILDIDLSEPEEEKGYVEKARDLWNNFGTSEFRFFQNNLFSPGSTFTENNLNETDIETLREVVANAMQDGRTNVDYEPDYGIPESEVNKKSPTAGLTDRYLRMARTLGGFSLDESNKNLTMYSVIDNLLKGAATQAIQNLNSACGLEELLGGTND